MKRLALAALLALSSASAGATSQPVLVEFGGLLWVQAAGGLPYLEEG